MFQKNRKSIINLQNISILILIIVSFFVLNFFTHDKVSSSNRLIQPIAVPELLPTQLIIPYQIADKPLIYSKTAALVDADTKYILYDKNSSQRVPIASTTKLMTALVVMDNFKLEDVLTVGQKAASINGSQLNLFEDEQMTVYDLLKGLLVVSGNDAAYTFAQNFKSTEGNGFDAFVTTMNKKAEDFNLQNTHYLNPAGLDDEAYSSAFDLAVISAEFIKNPKLVEITKIDEDQIFDISGKIKHTLKNSNRLVLPEEALYMPEAIGLKTGFTGEAGHCLVSAIDYKQKKLISVILYTNEFTPSASAQESYKLLKWGKIQVDKITQN